MPGPATSGLFVYAKHLDRLVGFYEMVLQLPVVHRSPGMAVLQSQAMQLIVHAIPPHIAEGITIASPPQRREQTALKFFFSVPSIANARHRAAQQGGEVLTEAWEEPGFRVCNACDPEGNIFQVRESAA